MAYLLIMRHAKSDWSHNLPDFERPLNKRGVKDAKHMGAWLKDNYPLPDLLISSPAERAKQTMTLVFKAMGKTTNEIIWDKRIYEAGLDDLLEVISEHAKGIDCLMLTGHSPAVDHLVRYLSSDEPPRTADGKLMTTAAIAVLEFANERISTSMQSGKLIELARPKEV